MRTLLRRLLLTIILVLPLFIQVTLADPPGPPGPGGDPGGSGGVPVGSPIDSTTVVLLILAFCYGIYKIVEFQRKRLAEHSSK